MKAKITFLSLVCLAFAFMLALPSWAGRWRNDFEDEKVFQREKGVVWDEDLNVFFWEKGEVSGESRDPGIVVFIVTGELKWKDYSAECKVKLVEAFGAGEFGIALRRIPWQQPAYLFGLFPSQNMAKITTLPLSVIAQEKFEVEEDTWYKLKAVIEGKKMEFYINDEFFLKGKDAQFPHRHQLKPTNQFVG